MAYIAHAANVVRWKAGLRYRTNPAVRTTKMAQAITANMPAKGSMPTSTNKRATIDVPIKLPPHAGPGGGSLPYLSDITGTVLALFG
ncbi:hypothetical protein GCM10009537_02000 [Corynebacterium riegelii]